MESQNAKPAEKVAGRDPAPDEWENALNWSCTLSVVMPMPRITVRDLMQLEVNSILDTRESEEAALPIWVNGAMIGWAEFDVVGDRLAIRVTDLR